MSENGVPPSRWKRDPCYRTNGFSHSWSRRPRPIWPRQMVWIYPPWKTQSKTHGDHCLSGMPWVSNGSPSSAPLGSSFLQEYEHLRTLKHSRPNPRRHFLTDLQSMVLQLQDSGHAIVVMLDANSTISSDTHFSDFIESCGLNDLHSQDPAPSTYIGLLTDALILS